MWTIIVSMTAVIALAQGTGGAPASSTPGLGKKTAVQQKETVRIAKYPLKHVGAQQAYKTLGQGKYEGVDYISYDPTDNSLIIRGTEAGHKSIKAAIDNIDQDPKKQPVQVRRFPISHKPAHGLLAVLSKEVIKGLDFMTSDPSDNTIIARGDAAGLKALGKRISELDRK